MKKSGADKKASGPMKEVFRQQLEGYQAQPSDRLWERLELTLDKRQLERERKNTRTYKYLAVAALLMLGMLGSLFVYRNLQKSRPEIAVQTPAGQATGTEATHPNQPAKPAASNSNAATPIVGREQAQEAAAGQEQAKAAAPQIVPSASAANHAAASGNSSGAPTGKSAAAAQPGRTNAAPSATRVVTAPGASPKAINSRNESTRIARKPGRSEVDPAAGSLALASRTTKSSSAKNENAIASASGSAVSKSVKNSTAPSTSTSATDGQPGDNSTVTKQTKNADPVVLAPAVVADENGGTSKPDQEATTPAQSTEPAIANVVPVTRPADSAATAEPVQASQLAAAAPADENPEATKVKKAAGLLAGWSVGAVVSPTWMHQNIVLPEPQVPQAGTTGSMGSPVEEYNQYTKTKMSLMTGLMVSKTLGDFIRVETGFTLGTLEATSKASIFKNENSAPTFPPTLIPDDQMVLTPYMLAQLESDQPTESGTLVKRTTNHDLTFRYRQVGIPVLVQAQAHVGNFTLFGGGGLQYTRMLQVQMLSDSEEIREATFKKDNSPFRKSNTYGLATAGIGYKIGKRWQIRASGNYSKAFSPLLQNKELHGTKQKTPHTVGASAGLWFNF